ncbi:Crp/Fnr family transcriptional regulator [Trinickia dabaoshanensis]|uniref:Crp/Fnr family transcriptional regulator n=1 Tax=Trinickia dabaoshanensis TaxID=564714 RepID=A0A2N7VRM0_9BURK|nr:helix-turn-helix domain-containing protein [Trinickia dabaoshanensis]PMS19811.1 Crp/Fnr family transcriptional regulator [Trinickia dabaoshanensis]
MHSTTLAEIELGAPRAAMSLPHRAAGRLATQGARAAAEAPIAWHAQLPESTPNAARAAERNDCEHCSSRKFCMPEGFDTKKAGAQNGVFGNTRKVKQGEAIFRAGEPFKNLYVAKVGSCKTVAIDNDGREQIIGFPIAGEFIGLDGIGTGVHAFDAVALEDGVVCALPFNALTEMSEHDFSLRSHLHKLMSRELVRESALLMLMGRMTALERLVSFLLNISKRYAQRGYSSHDFNLRMTRDEIGCHLGLTLETVSRSLSKLSSLGLVKCAGKQVSIIDMAGLEEVSGHYIPH